MFNFIKNWFKEKKPYVFSFETFSTDFKLLKSLDKEFKFLEKQLEVTDLMNQDIICDKMYKLCDNIEIITLNLEQIKLDDLSEKKDKELVSQFLDYQENKNKNLLS